MSDPLPPINELQSTDNFVMKPKSKVTIHSVMVVLMLSLVFTFIFVLGISYFFDNSILKGHSSTYFCPTDSSSQLGVCLKS